jgi:prepilin-type N-terminal cleavage/methylation domain-containing protein
MRHQIGKSAQRIGRAEAGFTLMELLIVIGIITALAAASIPLVTRFVGSGESGSQTLEMENIQAAVDAMMAEAGVALLDPNTAATSAAVQTWTALPMSGGQPILVAGVAVDLTDYMRLTGDQTAYHYCWDSTGLVDEQLIAAGNCS